jgi:hypothetical protein
LASEVGKEGGKGGREGTGRHRKIGETVACSWLIYKNNFLNFLYFFNKPPV